MKKRGIILSIIILVILLIIVFLGFRENSSKNIKEEVDENSWSFIADKYHYNPETLPVQVPSDLSDREIIDIYIVDKKNIDKKLFLEGVYFWKIKDDNTALGILIPQRKGIHEVIHYLPEALNYHFFVQKSDKKVGQLTVNEPLLEELMKNFEYVEPDGKDDYIYTTD